MNRMSKFVLMLFVVAFCGLQGCGREILYSVSVANYGDYGVILQKLPVKFNRPTEIEPGIPGVRADIYEKSHFRNYPDSLPDQVEVVWQLAELKNCDEVIEGPSFLDENDPHVYARKSGCTFVPIEGKVFRKVIDMKELMNTKAGQKAGKRTKPWWTLSTARYGLSIAFEFRDEELEVRALSYRTNPWS